MGSTFSTAVLTKHHIPTPDDVYEVRRGLLARVPAELANKIIEDAQYWPKVSFSKAMPADKKNHPVREHHGPVCCLVTPILFDWIGVEESVNIKEVHFRINSHDQGWCSDDSFQTKYMGSWTWFEAAIIRGLIYDAEPAEPDNFEARIEEALDTRKNREVVESITVTNPDDGSDVWEIQRNIRALRRPTVHEVVWTDMIPNDEISESEFTETTGAGRGAGFVRSLKLGDRIAVIARAMYPGWVNSVVNVEVEVLYSV